MSVDQQDRDQNAGENGWQPQPQPPVQPKKHRRWPWAVVGVLAVIVAGSVIGGLSGTDEPTRPISSASQAPAPVTPTPAPTPAPEVTVQAPENEAPAEAPTQAPTPKPKPKPSLTVAQENATDKANDYLDYSSFSRKGLIDQLKFEGFSTKDATFAVDHIEVNWNRQAVDKAEEYLDYDSFSRQGLIDQLEFEGFTHSQAVYGVDKTGL
jgi:hypothetical protein